MRAAARPKKIRRRRVRICAIVICTALLLSLLWLESSLRPTVEQNAQMAARNSVTQLLCQSAEESMAAAEGTPFTTVLYDTNGMIAAVEVSAPAVNRLQNSIVARASELLQDHADAAVPVPLGSAGGMTLFSASGPTIRVRIRPHGAVTPQLQSSLEAAGINQTLHRLTLLLSCEVELIAPLCRETICVEYPCLLAETLLVGDLPDYMLAGFAQQST